ncbi:hypothetical protein ACFE04_001992 [Oxalis oulophora]
MKASSILHTVGSHNLLHCCSKGMFIDDNIERADLSRLPKYHKEKDKVLIQGETIFWGDTKISPVTNVENVLVGFEGDVLGNLVHPRAFTFVENFCRKYEDSYRSFYFYRNDEGMIVNCCDIFSIDRD